MLSNQMSILQLFNGPKRHNSESGPAARWAGWRRRFSSNKLCVTTARGGAKLWRQPLLLPVLTRWLGVVNSSQPVVRQQLLCQGQFAIRQSAASEKTRWEHGSGTKTGQRATANAHVCKLDGPPAESQDLHSPVKSLNTPSRAIS